MPTATAVPYHPAKFSEPLLEVLDRLVRAEQRRLGRPVRVLDPFAGVGRVHQLALNDGRIRTVGIEIEPEWAAAHRRTICANSLVWMAHLPPELAFDIIVTSPTYGNRLADSHDAQDGSTRHSYTHDLGRKLTPGNSGAMPWGERYFRFHGLAYACMHHALRPGGLALVNVSDFYRAKALVQASLWHQGAMVGAGFVRDQPPRLVPTPRMRGQGAEATEARAEREMILRYRRPELAAA